eukprot:354497-Chlamydomonas_euryale.AAC.1
MNVTAFAVGAVRPAHQQLRPASGYRRGCSTQIKPFQSQPAAPSPPPLWLHAGRSLLLRADGGVGLPQR